jgi:hypothetical protein
MGIYGSFGFAAFSPRINKFGLNFETTIAIAIELGNNSMSGPT